jgi:hypothetical protein
MADNVIQLPYKPRQLQQELHSELQRFNVFNIHRRFGKTVFAINELIKQITENPLTKPRGAYIAPLYRQAKSVAWDYLKEFTRPIPGMKYNESELRADFPNGARITLYGADSPDSLRGMYFDCVILDEVAQMSPRLWSQVIRPALADRKGSAIFIGTPFGMANQFHELYEIAGETDNWYRRTLTCMDTGYIDEDELDAARREMSIEEFNQEFMCSWSAAIKGAYYAKEMAELEEANQITNVPYDENYPVITSADIGMKDSFVIWYYQVIGSQIRVIRCDAFTGMKLSQIFKKMESHGYRFSQHIAPHDIRVREMGSGSRWKVAARLGVRYDIAPLPTAVSRQDGINMVRSILPRCWFDRANCKDGIEALKTYRSEYNDIRKVYSLNPLHDWTSDYADSLRYFAITKHKTSFEDNEQYDYEQMDMGVY